MRIRLRPYHPSYVISFYARGTECTGMNGKGFNYVIKNIRNNPNSIEIEFVLEYDDICNRCDKKSKMQMDPFGEKIILVRVPRTAGSWRE